VIEFLKHWQRALTGSVVSIPFLVYSEVTGKNISLAWFICLVLAGLCWDLYSQRHAQDESIRPQLFLRVNPDYQRANVAYFGPGNGEFLLQTEGEKKAFGVKITSEDAIGKNHGRLALSWAPESTCVGSEPVEVSVLCAWHKGTHSVGTLGPQVEEYMAQVVGPKELIAMVRYTDIAGKPYKKRFRVYRDRDVIGFIKVHCEPLRDHETR